MVQRQGQPQAPADSQLTASSGVVASMPAPRTASATEAQGTGPGVEGRQEDPVRRGSMLERLQNSRNGLGLVFMLPAGVLMLLFLSYPLGLGVWLGFTDAKIGRSGEFIGLENYVFLAGDSVAQLALFNTLFYTVVASILKFMLGLWLAMLLNRSVRHATFLRAIVLLPFIVPTALSAIAFWWIYDSQFSIISWVLTRMGLIDHYIDFLGEPWNARLSTIAANVWRGIPFVAISLLAGLQTISPALYEAAAIDGATPWQRFWHITLPLLTPIIAVVMTFSVLFTFTDFQLIYVLTRGGPLNATHLMATLSFQRAISGGALGEGAALAIAMVPFLLGAILFSYFGLQRRAWQQGSDR
jgi:multiple sugar transport system permease protein